MYYDFKSIFKVTLPIFISILISQIIGITDVIFLGRVSTVAVGASGLGATCFFALFVIISGFAFGAQIMMSHRNGEQNYTKIGAVFYQGLFFLLMVSLILIGLSKFFLAQILRHLIASNDVLHATVSYLNWRIFGLIATSFIVMFRSFFVSIAQTSALQISSVFMLVSNIFLNYVLIFGHFGFSAHGIQGAAIASVISETIAVLTYFFYLLFQTDYIKYGFNRFVWRHFSLLKSILRISVWTTLQQFVSVVTWFLFFIAVEHLGETELAISNILKNSAGIPWTVVLAFGITASTVTGNLIGENKISEIIPANKKIIRLNAFVLIFLLIVFALFYYPILRLYTNDSNLITQSVYPYMTALLCYFPLFSGFIWFQSVSATGHTKYAMFIEFVSMILYLAFVGIVVLILKMPLYICMFSDGVYNLVIYIMSRKFMLSLKWAQHIK